jgi:pimeloyl-ACP methyl ester carboxylesterase
MFPARRCLSPRIFLKETPMLKQRTRLSGIRTVVLASAIVTAAGCSRSELQPATQTPAAAADDKPTLRTVAANGINLRIAEMGKGPLVIFLHGFPESWYSWRHQLPALAKAGYHAVAPDMRGYGKSDKPAAVEDYDIQHLTGDVVGLIDALGEKTAVVVGHDWGSIIAWNCLLLHPDRFTALVAMSVPYGGRGAVSPLETMKKNFGENFYYVLYFQEPGVAEAEFDADPRGILSRLYLSPDSPRDPPTVTDPKRVAGGWIPRLGPTKGLPPWLAQADLDYYVNEFKQAGFRGGINYYRNFHRNWETTPQLAGATIAQPVLFIAGAQDGVIRRASAEQLTRTMSPVAMDLRGVKLFPGAGHWVQQERAGETNEVIIQFLTDAAKPAKATD